MHRLLDLLFPPRDDERLIRDLEPDGLFSALSPQLVPATRPGTAVLLPFHDPVVRAAIHEAKYHGSARASNLLAVALAEYLRDADESSRHVVIVPVPLGNVRRRERGFNQTEEVILQTLPFLEETGRFTIDVELLMRVRETASQVSLPRHAREENMRGAFGATHAADPAHLYIVLDDVVTTGATLQAAIDALTEAGAKNILPLALAH